MIGKRVADNQRLATIQKSASANNQKADHEITKVRADLAHSRRFYIGAAIYGAAARSTEVSSVSTTSGSNAADTGGRILSAEMDAAIKSLILETEEVAATGRAAQAFIRENGMAPP